MEDAEGRHPPWPVRHVRDAVLVPSVLDREHLIPFRFGGFDADGALLEEFRLRRFEHASPDPAPPAAVEATIDAPCVYGGFVQRHFGHFLLEGLARLWALRRLPDRMILWHGMPDAPWQHDLLRRVGLDPARFVAIDRPLRIRSLLLPEPGFVIGQSFDSRQVDALAVEPVAPADDGEEGARLWLSRTGLRPARKRVEGEEALEAILAAEGWRIFRPEAHGLDAQIAALGRAQVVAGIDGSAFHTLALLRGFAGRVLMVPRRGGGWSVSANHYLVLGAQGISLRVLPRLLERTDAPAGQPMLRVQDPAAAAATIAAA